MVALKAFLILTIMFLGSKASAVKQIRNSYDWFSILHHGSSHSGSGIGQHSSSGHGSSGSGHHSDTYGCDNVDQKDRAVVRKRRNKGDIMTGATCGAGDAHWSGTSAITFGFYEDAVRLLTEWYKYHSYDALRKFYYDVAMIDLSNNAGSLPGHKRLAGSIWGITHDHDEAYNHHNTVPDISHVESLVTSDKMNAMCRAEILTLIQKVLHLQVSTPETTKAVVHTTHAQTDASTHVPNTHAQTQGTTKHTQTQAPTTHATATHAPITHTQTPELTTHARTTQVPTTHAQTHASTTHASTSTPADPLQIKAHSCDTGKLVSALARTDLVTSRLAGFCKDGTRSENEALIITTCNSPTPSQWRQGANVLSDCSRIPRYSPIATFLLGNFVTDGTALSGVFVECTASGFKMAAQLCGHTPQVYEISTGSMDPRQNAGSYYIIDWEAEMTKFRVISSMAVMDPAKIKKRRQEYEMEHAQPEYE